MKKRLNLALFLGFSIGASALFFSCSKEQDLEKNQVFEKNILPESNSNLTVNSVDQSTEFPLKLTLDEMKKNKGGYIFTNKDNINFLEKGTQSGRSFQLNSFVSAKKYSEGTFSVVNYLPYDFTNVTIYIEANEFEGKLKLYTIEELPRFFAYYAQLPKLTGNSIFENSEGLKVTVKDTYLTGIRLSVEINDELYKKVSKIFPRTYIEFTNGKGAGSQSSFGTITMEQVRSYTAILANTWFVYSSPEFKNLFMNHPHRLYDDNNRDINREKVYNNLIRRGRLRLGITRRYSGVSGGIYFLLNPHHLGNNFYQPGNNSMDVFAHEMGHIVGFDHKSNMTYPGPQGHGYSILFKKLYSKMLKEGKLPFSTNPNKAEDGNLSPQFNQEIPFY